MDFDFANLKYSIIGDKIFLTDIGKFARSEGNGFCEIQVAGENKKAYGVKMIQSSEGERLTYVSHTLTSDKLVIVQRSQLVEVTSTFVKYDDCDSFRVNTCVKNISSSEIVLEEVSAFV